MIIAGLQKTTLIDYPGKIACVVFLAGCNFRCPWCYSSELVLPLKIVKQPRISEQEFFNFLRSRQGLLDGAVICGGEPTINKDLEQFVEKIKNLGFAVKLDTNGSNPKMLKDSVNSGLINYVAMDIKTSPKNPVYQKIMTEGITIDNIKESVEFFKNGNLDFEFRTTCVPTIHTKNDFLEIAEWIGGKNIKYYLQNFRAEKTIDPEFEKIKPFEKAFFAEVVKEISPYFKECIFRG
ncbi:MAG: anaerobic ribonucleoside-triphosphate reductase activating protein [Candidatus Staskawiczbacteria bacterium]|jgi:pyruvate formate lyase activating enzyme